MAIRGLLIGAVCSTAHGQFGGGGYDPPAPNCPAFSCSAGQVAAPKIDNQIWSYGCKESGMNVMNMASLDPNNPYANAGQKNLNKCCVEKDICKQTCGMTSKACHDVFQKCQKKMCKGDQNCALQAMMAEITAEPYDPEDEDKVRTYNPEDAKCKAYNKGQNASCECVPKDDYKAAAENKLKDFYGKFNPEKLDDMGDIKDVAEVWKKWSGKEPDMFMALATKYKEKAVEIREKPKPKQGTYRSEPKTMEASSEGDADSFSFDRDAASEEPAAPAEPEDPEEITFKEKRVAMETKKRKAKEEEDYGVAGEVKEELQALVKAEQERLTAKKKQAIADEDFQAAKKLKQRIERLSEL